MRFCCKMQYSVELIFSKKLIDECNIINIPFDEAYGARKAEMLIEIPKDHFPKDMEIELGMSLMMSNDGGQNFQVVVDEIKEDIVILDSNHPLAGQDLIFDLELVEIVSGKPIIIMP